MVIGFNIILTDSSETASEDWTSSPFACERYQAQGVENSGSVSLMDGHPFLSANTFDTMILASRPECLRPIL